MGAGRSVTMSRERLIRLLRMTESDRDAEALIAIRKTNAILKENGMSWSDVIDLPPPAETPFVSTDWSEVSLAGYERSDGIRRSVRREFPSRWRSSRCGSPRTDGDLLSQHLLEQERQAGRRGLLVAVLARPAVVAGGRNLASVHDRHLRDSRG